VKPKEATVPTPPSKPSLQSLVESVEASSTTLGEKATALSKVIENVDARLRKMSGKLEVVIETERVRLSFERNQRGWGLWLLDDDSCYDNGERVTEELTAVSVARKARAFPLLPRLLLELDKLHRQQVMEIDKAFKSLDEMEGE
jgi:hypothetical protein